jgi:histone acetyltransferase (RNA polymerase elongator complex component)
MFDRIFQLEEIGHIPNTFLPKEYVGAKLEMIISGGTFNFYPKEYITVKFASSVKATTLS